MALTGTDESEQRPTDGGRDPRNIAAVRVLRISLTDRCNARCVYCMPDEGVRGLPADAILSFEEIAQVVEAAVQVHGIGRFKLTGGEPTMRTGVVDLVGRLRRIKGIEELSMTTNGMLLEKLARPLKEAGLDRVTVSIDSLRPERFRRITRGGDLAGVLRGLEAASAAGFVNLKINCVTMRGINDDEVAEFARLTIHRPLTVRFIEYMPLGGCAAQDGAAEALVSEAKVRQRIESELGSLTPMDRGTESGVGPAVVYRLERGEPKGRVGFISAMSAPFCESCNRLRLTADGAVRSCLFERGEIDLKPILRDLAVDQRIAALGRALAACVALKPAIHGARGEQPMSRIGG